MLERFRGSLTLDIWKVDLMRRISRETVVYDVYDLLKEVMKKLNTFERMELYCFDGKTYLYQARHRARINKKLRIIFLIMFW